MDSWSPVVFLLLLGREVSVRRASAQEGLRGSVPDRAGRRVLHPVAARVR